MNYERMLLAAAVAWVAYFAVGGVLFGALRAMRNEFAKYPAIYRPEPQMRGAIPAGMVGMLVAIMSLAAIYAHLDFGGGIRGGALFGALIGVFAVGAFLVHNHVNLQIGVRLTMQQAIAYFLEWVVVGMVIGVVYRPVGG